jgi:hypothetical protein
MFVLFVLSEKIVHYHISEIQSPGSTSLHSANQLLRFLTNAKGSLELFLSKSQKREVKARPFFFERCGIAYFKNDAFCVAQPLLYQRFSLRHVR